MKAKTLLIDGEKSGRTAPAAPLQFAKGDRVSMSAKGISAGVYVNFPGRIGTVINQSQTGLMLVSVHWDGNAAPGTTIHPTFIEIAPAAPPTSPEPSAAIAPPKPLAPALAALSPGKRLFEDHPILALTPTSCRWVIGDPAGEFRYCLETQLGDGPYCSDHAMRAYNPQRPAKISVARGVR